VPEPPVVVALGGNAIAPPGGRNSVGAQFERTAETAWRLVHLADHPLLVTHGNGPQVGTALLRSDLAAEVVPTQPLDACVADTQGGMGYMLQQCLDNAFSAAGRRHPTVTVVTRTVVALDDPAFQRPSKPVGGFYELAEARRRMAEDRWMMREDAGRGWRRVVPSPEPAGLPDLPAVRTLLGTGAVVVCAGGGGVPVADGAGVEAVVDKDLTASLLARQLDADALLLFTDVAAVQGGYGTRQARPISRVTPAELRKREFPAGSMGPKIEAVCRFVEATGKPAAIGRLEDAGALLTGHAGTLICPDFAAK
jgi:carbamate kinase